MPRRSWKQKARRSASNPISKPAAADGGKTEKDLKRASRPDPLKSPTTTPIEDGTSESLTASQRRRKRRARRSETTPTIPTTDIDSVKKEKAARNDLVTDVPPPPTQKYNVSLKEVFLIVCREENQFISRNELTLDLVSHNRDLLPPYKKQLRNLLLSSYLSTRSFCYDWELDTFTYPQSVVGTIECERMIQSCLEECAVLWRCSPILLEEGIASMFSTEEICRVDVTNIPGRVVNEIASYVVDNNLDRSHRLNTLSAGIGSLEKIFDTCLSIPKLNPFFLPLAETKTVHYLSEFRDYVLGIKLLPCRRSTPSSSTTKYLFSSEAEVDEYARCVLNCVTLVRDVLVDTIEYIPYSLLPPTGRDQGCILGKKKEVFMELFESVASGSTRHSRDGNCSCNEEERMVSTLHAFDYRPLVDSGSNYKSIFDVLRHDGDGEKDDGGAVSNCECNVDSPHSPCRSCLSEQLSIWKALQEGLEHQEFLASHTLKFVKNCLSLFARSQPLTDTDEESEVCMKMATFLSHIVQGRRCQYYRAAIQSCSVIERLWSRSSTCLSQHAADALRRPFHDCVFNMKLERLISSSFEGLASTCRRHNRRETAAELAAKIPKDIKLIFRDLKFLLPLARIETQSLVLHFQLLDDRSN